MFTLEMEPGRLIPALRWCMFVATMLEVDTRHELTLLETNVLVCLSEREARSLLQPSWPYLFDSCLDLSRITLKPR